MARLRGAACALVAAVVLAGCSGTPASGLGDGLPTGEDDAAGGDAGTGAMLRFAEGNATRAEGSFEGSFADQDTCTTTCPEDRHDLTALVPTGYPVRLTGIVEESDSSAATAGVHVMIEADDATFHASRYTVSATSWEVWRTITVHSGSVELVINPVGFGSLDYTADVAVDADPTLILPATPTALHLDAGVNLTIETGATGSEDDGRIAYLLYDPDDRPATRLDTQESTMTWAVPADAAGGEYVLLALSDAGPVRATVDGSTETSLRVVAVTGEDGPGRSVAGQDRVEWEHDVSRPPVAIGAYLTYEHFYLHVDPDRLTVTNPDGVFVFEGELGAAGYTGALLFVSALWISYSERGLPELVPGTYSFAYEPDETLTGDVGTRVLFLDRS
jgi:hypothetical protein